MHGLISGCGAAEAELKRVMSTHKFPTSAAGEVPCELQGLLWVCALLPQDSSTALVIFDLDLFSLHLKVQVFHFQPLNIPTYELA